MIHIHSFVLLGLLALPCTTAAQTDPWERIGLIDPGRKVEIRQFAGKRISGNFAGFDATAVKVKTGGGDVVSIARGNVRSVS
jgi:hypothetical protein